MKVSTPISRTIRSIFTLLTAAGLLFATTNLVAYEPPLELNPDGPVDPRAREHGNIPLQSELSDKADAKAKTREVNAAVDNFSEFVTSFQRDQAYNKYINTYAIRGLRSLTETLGAMISSYDEKLMQEQQTVNNQIIAIEMMPSVDRDVQPSIVQDAFIDVATLFVNVQRQYYPTYDRQSQNLARLATSIVPDTPIQEQTEQINQFFVTAGATLEHMAQQPVDPIGGGPLDNPGQQTQNDPNIDPTPDPVLDPRLDPTIDPNVGDNLDRDYDNYNNNDNVYDNEDIDPGNKYPNTPGTQPYDRDPLSPTYPVDPTEPLDPTDPMEITPIGPAQPFDASNPEQTAPLD